jgi:hypothetical protein
MALADDGSARSRRLLTSSVRLDNEPNLCRAILIPATAFFISAPLTVALLSLKW